jgi:hypothetical protein
MDDEGDSVVLRTENEMKHAVALNKDLLRVQMVKKDDSASPSPSSGAPSTSALRPIKQVKEEHRAKVKAAKDNVKNAQQSVKQARDSLKVAKLVRILMSLYCKEKKHKLLTRVPYL